MQRMVGGRGTLDPGLHTESKAGVRSQFQQPLYQALLPLLVGNLRTRGGNAAGARDKNAPQFRQAAGLREAP
jgi:hypothetical protein